MTVRISGPVVPVTEPLIQASGWARALSPWLCVASIRQRLLAAALPLSLLLASPALANAPGDNNPAPPGPVSQSTVRIYPDHYRRRTVRYTPPARPSVGRVHRIIAMEAKRWRVSRAALSGRIRCESEYRWWASNPSGATGLAQFKPETFARGLRSMPRRVKHKTSRIRRLHTRLVTTGADGRRASRLGFRVKVRRARVLRGRLPRWPAITHGYVQVRLAARALAGRGSVSSSEWAC